MNTIKGTITPLHDKVLVTEMNFGEQTTKSGIVIRSTDGKTDGIHPRWARVWAVGPEQKDVEVNDWILIEHGRWTRGFEVESGAGQRAILRGVDLEAIMLVSAEPPPDILLAK